MSKARKISAEDKRRRLETMEHEIKTRVVDVHDSYSVKLVGNTLRVTSESAIMSECIIESLLKIALRNRGFIYFNTACGFIGMQVEEIEVW